MNFDLNEDQLSIQASIEKVCEKFDDEYWLERDRNGVFPHDFHRTLADNVVVWHLNRIFEWRLGCWPVSSSGACRVTEVIPPRVSGGAPSCCASFFVSV